MEKSRDFLGTDHWPSAQALQWETQELLDVSAVPETSAGFFLNVLNALLGLHSLGFGLPFGEHTKSNWKWPFIVDFPIKHGDFPLLC